MTTIKPFTIEQEETIKREYLITPIKSLAKKLGLNPGRINRYLKRNDLEIPEEIRKQRKLDSTFKKGSTPHNKGKKITEYTSAESIARSAAGRFKKGLKPHNTKKVGDISIRKDADNYYYKYIKLADSDWVLYHRYLWEKEYGEIPEGYIVTFKDKNTLNTDLDNLKLVSCVENMFRNSRQNYPEEIIPSMVLLNKLQKKINNIENE
jgi:hypothetical protein